MPFQYKVRDPLGNVHEGTIEAASADDAQQQLRRDGFFVLDVDEAKGEGLGPFARRVTKGEIIYVTSQLAIMVDTGITLSVALDSIIQQEQNPTLRRVLGDLKQSVEGGEDFSTALARHPKHFDRTFVSLVRASEATGTLAEILERIAAYLRKEVETRGKIRSAMAYPTVMMVVAVAVTIFLLVYILPKFMPLFTKKGASLPKPTIVMMALSKYMIDYWYLWLVGAASLVGGIIYARHNPYGRRAIDWLKINSPVVGPMFRKVTISRSVRTLGTMIASGVSVLDALKLSADVSGNVYYQEIWNKVLDDVTTGNQIHEGLAGNSLIPPMLVQMIRSGEDTGKLDIVLEKVSTYFDQEVETALKTATSLIEPIMITVMGVVVGGIAMSLLLPIFSLSRTAG